jgi:hypothetical protein
MQCLEGEFCALWKKRIFQNFCHAMLHITYVYSGLSYTGAFCPERWMIAITNHSKGKMLSSPMQPVHRQ